MTPNVLVISNECFSKISSNGRTLGNFFVGWPKECLAQFFIIGEPDDYYCNRYFRVSDRQALNAILGRGSFGGECEINRQTSRQSNDAAKLMPRSRKTPRNALTMLGRDLIWKSAGWKKSGYWNWVKAFKPDVVLLQAGDCAFMYDLAVETAKYQNAKLVIYNSEGYYYKDFDYFRGQGVAHAIYPLFLKRLRRAITKAYESADCDIYICDELREQYARDFNGRAETVFTGSEIVFEKKNKENAAFTTVYCGNLGLKRHESLIDIAEELQRIDRTLFVDVYGNAPTDEVEQLLKECEGIHFHGLVSYEKVKQLLRDSDLLLYVESFDKFYQEDLKFGFSTKIADSLSSGNCLLMYSPEHFACHQYLKKNQAAYTASDKKQLHDILEELVRNPASRQKYQESALKLAALNHNNNTNKEKFQSILYDISK